jgi:hypothetical protein
MSSPRLGIQFRSAHTLVSTGLTKIQYFHDYLRGAVSYTTGTHTVKVGGNLWHGGITTASDSQGYGPVILRLLNGVPNGVVYRVDPQSAEERFLKGAVFAQAQSTFRRLTANYGLRIDTQDSGYPAQHLPPTAYFAARDFEAGKVIEWRDWSPRLGCVRPVREWQDGNQSERKSVRQLGCHRPGGPPESGEHKRRVFAADMEGQRRVPGLHPR